MSRGDGSRLRPERISHPDIAGFWRWSARHHDPALAAERERQTERCAYCGDVALYRVYDKGGVNRGACKFHREAAAQSSRMFRRDRV